ncbi:MAG: prealbumin-like fold domain-containing protein [Acidobacteria bacterium]|nr:prealbumin-like fold domain-containing protein [Acidobacteriota bacterium]
MRPIRLVAIAVLVLLSLGVSARDAAAQKILLLYADTLARAQDVQSKLVGTGDFAAVDLFNVSSATPSLSALAGYQAVLVWSNLAFANPDALGNVLADYSDQGGGVVQSTFGFRIGSFGLGGRWDDPNFLFPNLEYLPFSEGNFASGILRTLIPVVPGHPLLANVASFSGGTGSFLNTVAPRPSTTLVARWSAPGALPLLGARSGPKAGTIVGLNMYPPSAAAVTGGWAPATDGARLMANALLYVASPFFSRSFDPPDGACICTPLLMNTNEKGAQHWWVRADADGGALTIAAIAHAVNSADPETVNAKVYDSADNLVLDLTASYVAGQDPGFETSDAGAVTAAPGAIYRIAVTTPDTPSTQPHYRLRFHGADAAGTASPSSPSFEHQGSTWYFNVGDGELLKLRVFVTGTPNAALGSTLNYTLIDPNGLATAGSVTAASSADAFINDPGTTPTPGTWALRVDSASEHYRLDKVGGADRGIYVSWLSAGEGTLRLTAVTPVSGGAPVTGEVGFTVRDAAGTDVRSGTTTTGEITFDKLPPGRYTVVIAPPPTGIVSDASIDVYVFCDDLALVEFVVLDQTPPDVQSNAPATITPPDAPVAFTATAVDFVSTPTTAIAEFTCTATNGSGRVVDKRQSCVVEINGATITILDSGGVGDRIGWTLVSTDAAGNQTTETFYVDVVSPGSGGGAPRGRR